MSSLSSKSIKIFFLSTILFVLVNTFSVVPHGIAAEINESHAINLSVSSLTSDQIHVSTLLKGFDKDSTRIQADLHLTEQPTNDTASTAIFSGAIITSSGAYDFKTEGSVFLHKDENASDVVGVFTGDLSIGNKVQTVSFGVHYSLATGDSFITSCIGTDDGVDKPAMLDFGEPYSSINAAVIAKQKYEAAPDLQFNSDIAQTPTNNSPALVEEDIRYKNSGTGGNKSLEVAVYFQNRARVQTNNKLYAKASGNKTNFENYIRSQYGKKIVANSTSANNIIMKLVSSNDNFEYASTTIPNAGSTAISFVMPVYIGSPLNLGWQTLQISIPTSSITITKTNSATLTPGKLHIVQWKAWRLAEFASTSFFMPSTSPYAYSGGMGVSAVYSYFGGVSGIKPITVGATASATFSCVEDAAYYITRTYNISATAASTMNIVP